MVRIDKRGLRRSELKLDYCHTRLAEGDDTAWIQSRFSYECTQRGTHVGQNAGCLVIDWRTRTRGRFRRRSRKQLNPIGTRNPRSVYG